MVLDSKIAKVTEAFGVQTIDDWQNIRPGDVLSIEGVGPSTLDHVRIYLAARGKTLRDDETPAYWQANLSASRIGTQISDEDKFATVPYTILIDSKEQKPWMFRGFVGGHRHQYRPLIVPHEWKDLGVSHGDYSVKGFEGKIHIERKSAEDAVSTFLAWGDRREQWQRTLAYLSGIECSMVAIECSYEQMLMTVGSYGKKSVKENRRCIRGQVSAWMQDYGVQFAWLSGRRLAEDFAFWTIDRYVRHAMSAKPPTRSVTEVLSEM